jgi:hypothetical protein
MRGAIPPLRNTLSWRGVQLKHRDSITLTFTFTFTPDYEGGDMTSGKFLWRCISTKQDKTQVDTQNEVWIKFTFVHCHSLRTSLNCHKMQQLAYWKGCIFTPKLCQNKYTDCTRNLPAVSDLWIRKAEMLLQDMFFGGERGSSIKHLVISGVICFQEWTRRMNELPRATERLQK